MLSKATVVVVRVSVTAPAAAADDDDDDDGEDGIARVFFVNTAVLAPVPVPVVPVPTAVVVFERNEKEVFMPGSSIGTR